jgi:hypothetical protein
MKRLVAETDDTFERALLESVRLDTPPEHGARDAALSLAAGITNLPAQGGSGPRAAGPLGGEHLVSAKLGLLGAWKWLGIGALVGGIAGAGAMAGYQALHARGKVEVLASAVGSAGERARSAPSEPAASSPPVMAVIEAPGEAPSASNTAESRTRAAPPITQSPSTLAAEAAAIDHARRVLAAGSPNLAVELLSRYERESPTHALAPEARVLRIQAEKARGNGALAKQLAQKFLAAHPDDPHAPRVRRVLSPGSP